MLEKNDLVELTVEGITSDGSGVARDDGIAVFVPLALPGDRIEARILKTAKSCIYGKLERIITPSPDRIEPDCAVFGKCGGCAYRDAEYAAELRYKKDKMTAALRRIGGINVDIPDVIGCDDPDCYRNKLMLPVGVDFDGFPRCGFYAKRSHRIVQNGGCALHPEIFMQIAHFTFDYLMAKGVSAYDETVGRGQLRHIYIRQAPTSGEIMLCIVVNGEKLDCGAQFAADVTERFPEIKSVVMNVNRADGNIVLGVKCVTLAGSDYIYGTLRGVNIRISPLSFFQVNSAQTVKLYDIAEEFAELTPETRLLDLYCGAGLIGLSMASKVKELIGVEIIPDAIEDAKANAAASGITNAEFFCGDAPVAAEKLRCAGREPDVVIVDPPRAGCAPALVYTVTDMKPERIVYISCDVATQARDLKLFAERGYKTVKAQGIDMFPRTAHVESGVLMSRAGL